MSDKQVWFGTEGRMTWIPAPSPGVGRSLKKWRVTGQYINGGAFQRESASGARELPLSWPVMTGDKVRQITTYLEGTYGKGPFYYSDPFAENYNAAPQWLAAPWLATDDAPSLRKSIRPSVVTTPANSYDYPTYGAVYTVAGDGEATIKLPVPSGFTAHVGAHGSATGTGSLKLNGSALTLLGVTTSTLTNTTVVGPTFVSLRLGGTGTVTLYGIIVALQKTGVAAPTGSFRKGEGYVGLKLWDDPQITGYSSAQDRQSVSATFMEVEPWQ